ncbi:MAG: metallophosphoesterase [Gemmataceae bacterium]
MAAPQPAPVRLAHLSDIHVTTRRLSWRREDWLNKRLAAWMNLRLLGRGFRFRNAERVMAALRHDLLARRPDHVLFSGDASAMGFEEEIGRAAALLPLTELAGLAVPGNHDYCTRTAMHSGVFERHFAAWQTGERVGDAIYPFAQRVGPLWLVAVNSATANRWAWDARGEVGAAQLDRLDRLLGRLPPGPRILVTHYPVALSDGRPERAVRGLRDLTPLLAIANRGGVGLWLHGHRHDLYYLPRNELVPFPVLCAGSTTQTGHWSYFEYSITGDRLTALQRVYEPADDGFRDGPTMEVELGWAPVGSDGGKNEPA